jgi:ActR/RegA family two-component response regulator
MHVLMPSVLSACSSGHFSGAASLRTVFIATYARRHIGIDWWEALVSTAAHIPGTAQRPLLAPTERGWAPRCHAAGRPSVLLVDDDHSIVDVYTRVIDSLDIQVVSALDGRRALAAAHRMPFNLWLLELKLPDLHGLDVVRQLRAQGLKTPFIVASGHATVPCAVEATKLGALSVLEKPVRLDDLRGLVRSVVASTALDRLVCPAPHTPSERWCNFVIGLIASEHDLKTDGPWAKHVGVSLSTLRDCCRRVNVKVEDARNFGRALRAIYRSGECWTPEIVLDIDDGRTLKKFEERSGVERGLHARGRGARTPAIEEFFERQTWLPHDNPALLAIKATLMEMYHHAVPHGPRLVEDPTSMLTPSWTEQPHPEADVSL